MKIYYLLFTFITIVNCYFLNAQSKTLQLNNSDIQIGIDYNSKNYIVFNGFDFFYTKFFYAQEWKITKYKHNELPDTKDFPYNYFNVKGKNYLVSKGCGEVYEFRNDSIVRIDNSFQHKNQFESCSFVYKDEIYYFGGYGLFTFKNILTKFDFKIREWELVKYNDYENIPEPRQSALSFLKDDFLYIISGYAEDNKTNQTTGTSKRVNDIWKLDLKTRKWNFIGNINPRKELLYNFYGRFSYQTENKMIYDNNRLFEFDFENNTLKFSEPKDKYLFSSCEKYNNLTNEIIYILRNADESNKNVKIIIENFKDYKTNFTNTEKLISDYKLFYFLCIILIIVVTLALYLFQKRKKINKKDLYHNCITYKIDTFYHKEKVINNLTIIESDLLKFFFNNYNTPIQMNEVVDFISKNDATSYNTLTKKKDTILNSLKQKLAFILDISEDDLFIYQKNNEDKRIKEIQLNPQYFKI
jgi:hypothetical protein